MPRATVSRRADDADLDRERVGFGDDGFEARQLVLEFGDVSRRHVNGGEARHFRSQDGPRDVHRERRRRLCELIDVEIG